MDYQTSTKCSQQPSQCDGVSDNLSQVDKRVLKKRSYKATSPSQSAIEQARFYLSLYKQKKLIESSK